MRPCLASLLCLLLAGAPALAQPVAPSVAPTQRPDPQPAAPVARLPVGTSDLADACTRIAQGNALPAMALFRSQVLSLARSPNLDDSGARRILDGVVQDFRIPGRRIDKVATSIYILFVDSAASDRPHPDWTGLTGAEREREIKRLSLQTERPFRIIDPSATLSPEEALRQGTTVQVRAPELPFWAGRLRGTSILILGCGADPAASFAASMSFEMSSRNWTAATTLLLLVGIWAFLVTVAPGSREARRLAAELAARASDPVFRSERKALLAEAATLRLRSLIDPVVVTQDQLGYGSIARLQIVFFTFVVFAALAYILQRAGVLQEISGHILWLLGIAGAGSALSSVVSANRAASRPGPTRETIAWLGRSSILPDRLRVGAWQDLIVSDGEVDPYRLQILVFSGLVGGFLLVAGANELAALRIPDNLMALLGLSQVIYVGGKALNPPADWSEANAAVAAAADAEGALRKALVGRLRERDAEANGARRWTGAFSASEMTADGGDELRDYEEKATAAAHAVRPLLSQWSPYDLQNLPPL